MSDRCSAKCVQHGFFPLTSQVSAAKKYIESSGLDPGQQACANVVTGRVNACGACLLRLKRLDLAAHGEHHQTSIMQVTSSGLPMSLHTVWDTIIRKPRTRSACTAFQYLVSPLMLQRPLMYLPHPATRCLLHVSLLHHTFVPSMTGTVCKMEACKQLVPTNERDPAINAFPHTASCHVCWLSA